MRLLPFLLLFCLSFPVPAQNYLTAERLGRRDQKALEDAQAAARQGRMDEALEEVNKLLERVPQAVDALLLRAAVYHDREELAASEEDYERAIALAPDHSDLAYYQLALTEFRREHFSEAVAHFEAFLSRSGISDRRRERAEAYLADARLGAELKEHPVEFEPTALSDSINTDAHEVLPSFTADGNTLVYTHMSNFQEDFYYSTRDSAGNWRQGQPLTALNSPDDEGAQTISADGRLLVFTICYREDGVGNCDLYFSEKQDGRWQRPRNMGEGVNSPQWDSQASLSGNGRRLFFSSSRPRGQGGRDIWVSERQPDGRWSVPVNAGPTINTAGNEESPFIHADGQTLYFMSDGHPGLGGYDLFLARLDSSGSWQRPKNLGYPINTAAAEGALVVSLDGRTAYYASDKRDRDGTVRADNDIYQFPLYEAARPRPVTFVRGRVMDARSERPLADVAVQVVPEERAFLRNEAITDPDGRFLLVLPAGEDYAFTALADGYLFYSDRFYLADGFTRRDPFELDIALQPVPEGDGAEPVEAGEPVILRNVLFATGSAELLPASSDELNRLLALLKEYPDLEIRINGHTDNVGMPEDNLLLSKNRAKAVYDFLVAEGITPERISYQGFGESRPIADNATAEGRRKNRRTEFEVVEQAF